ncbi:MAG TPA: FecR domain-containing protein [Puia sp.]|jgi:ferric-dicitrate binding protein FerR (iron transport regulator)
MPLSRLEHLFDRYTNYDCDQKEQEELMSLLALPENEHVVQRLIERLIENTGSEKQMPDQAAASVLKNILEKDKGDVIPINRKKTIFFPRMRAAAVVILLMAGTAAWWVVYKNAATGPAAVAAVKKRVPVSPGGDRALLTMSDGSTVVLDSLPDKTFRQGGAQIKNQAGLLTYRSPASTGIPSDAPVAYNTVTTPKGGQYRVVLSDGTKVWLNAASSLYFPTAFAGGEREVRVTGEAYFEVAQNREKPFRVVAGDMQIKVLGTHFNVNAYPDEKAIRASLLEGSVKITEDGASGLLKPGQQAMLDKGKAGLEITDADMDEVMAWKNGLFQFDGADITTIMRQIGRWYDVEIEFSGKIPDKRFEGKISRSAALSDVLQILELSNVKFSMEGRKIIVQ